MQTAGVMLFCQWNRFRPHPLPPTDASPPPPPTCTYMYLFCLFFVLISHVYSHFPRNENEDRSINGNLKFVYFVLNLLVSHLKQAMISTLSLLRLGIWDSQHASKSKSVSTSDNKFISKKNIWQTNLENIFKMLWIPASFYIWLKSHVWEFVSESVWNWGREIPNLCQRNMSARDVVEAEEISLISSQSKNYYVYKGCLRSNSPKCLSVICLQLQGMF